MAAWKLAVPVRAEPELAADRVLGVLAAPVRAEPAVLADQVPGGLVAPAPAELAPVGRVRPVARATLRKATAQLMWRG